MYAKTLKAINKNTGEELELIIRDEEAKHDEDGADNLTTTELGFWLQARQGKVLADRLSVEENLKRLKFIGYRQITNSATGTLQLSQSKCYIIFAWHGAHLTCTGLYLALTGDATQGIKTILASDHITSISVANNVLSVQVDSYGNNITVFEIPN